jgi:hypothetical protein
MATNVKFNRQRVGAVRPSQLIYTFGVGSLLDLPNFSAVVGGLDNWPHMGSEQHQKVLVEPRLLAAVRYECGHQVQEMRTPPWLPETNSPFDTWARTGVPIFPFPRWMRCTRCGYMGLYDNGQFELYHPNPYRPDLAQFVHSMCAKKGRSRAVPARVVVACAQGHLDEFPWMHFVHGGNVCSAPRLVVAEAGTGTRSTDLYIKCEGCEQGKNLNTAFQTSRESVLPACRGRHAHLRRFEKDACGAELKPLLLGASNLWFPVTRSALSLPAGSDPLANLIENAWDKLKTIPDEKLETVIEFAAEYAALKVYGEKAIQAVKARRAKAEEPEEGPPNLLLPEWRLFTSPQHAPTSSDFQLREVAPPVKFEKKVERVVLVERLREVMAMIGFTRVDGPDREGSAGPPPVALADDPKKMMWVPAAESRGEGLFLQLPEAMVDAWAAQVSPTQRIEALRQAHFQWRERRGLQPTDWPGARFLLLHTLAHALINEFALECGYAAASIRERIYAAEGSGSSPAMAGILLYTAAPDSEGTLGGLVALGEPVTLGRLLRQALDRAGLCSTDPMCADHTPAEMEDTLHNAACHACMLIPETSCERGNRYLDRAVLVDTLADAKVHYFG